MLSGSSAELVRALVSGLSSGPRERRIVVALQCFLDESGNSEQDKVYVLGGFIATTGQWEGFANEWDAALAANSAEGTAKLDYFKHSEASSLRGQFTGWTEKQRDNRMIDLCRIICAHRKYFIYTAIRHETFNRLIRSLPAPVRTLGTDTPYLTLYWQILANVAVLAERHGEKESIDLIFDEQGAFTKEADEHWPLVLQMYDDLTKRNNKPNLLAKRPIFRDEKSFTPIQAADFLVGQIRANLARSALIKIPPNPLLLSMTSGAGWGWETKEEQLQLLATGLKADTQRWFEDHPDTLPQYFNVHAAKHVRKKMRNKMLMQKQFPPESDKSGS